VTLEGGGGTGGGTVTRGGGTGGGTVTRGGGTSGRSDIELVGERDI
jgi:hypothetical protein